MKVWGLKETPCFRNSESKLVFRVCFGKAVLRESGKRERQATNVELNS